MYISDLLSKFYTHDSPIEWQPPTLEGKLWNDVILEWPLLLQVYISKKFAGQIRIHH